MFKISHLSRCIELDRLLDKCRRENDIKSCYMYEDICKILHKRYIYTS